MIDWINEGCKHWGAQMRSLYIGKDGWPSRSILGKLIDEGALGASSARFMQFFPECLDIEALRFNNAIKKLSEEDRELLFIHYVVIGKGKVKAARMDMPTSTYYDRLEATHSRLTRELYLGALKLDKKAPIAPDINAVALVL